MNGLFNEMTFFNGVPETVANQLKNIDEWGGPGTFPHFAAGWRSPATRLLLGPSRLLPILAARRMARWCTGQRGSRPKVKYASQWHHVVDVAPTVLEAAGLPFPKSVNGSVQKPFEGMASAYTLNDAKAKDRHLTQYFEIAGNPRDLQ